MLRPNSQSDLALGFDAGHKGCDEVLARYSLLPLGDREERACDGAGRVNDSVEMGVIVVMDVRRYAVY